MGNTIHVGIAECKIARPPDVLACSALGSCVGVCIYDKRNLTGGVVHVLLPNAGMFPAQDKPAKFADLGVEFLVRQMERNGSDRRRLTAKLAGGAKLFDLKNGSIVSEIGERNTEVVKAELRRLGIPVTAEDTGGNYGRSILFDPANGTLNIRSVKVGVKTI